MTPTPVTRKQGVGLLKPVAWNNGRRFTSPGPGPALGSITDTAAGIFGSEVRLQIYC